MTFTQNYAAAVVACEECGLVYRNPRPPSDAIVHAYKADQYDQTYLLAEFETQCMWFRTKIPVLAQQLAVNAVEGHPRVLEIGSFVGAFLYEGQAAGWEMFGIDPGRDVTAFCRDRQLPVFRGTVQEAKLSPASFDAIVVWNTFDQLPDPHAFLSTSMPLLKDGGLFVIRVPHGSCFEWAMSIRRNLHSALRTALDSALAWNNLLTFPYLYGYSIAQLSQLMAQYGFQLRTCFPDTLASAPFGHLRWWATLEECAVKVLCRVAASFSGGNTQRRFYTAPWLDIYFERACMEKQTEPAGAALGLLPVYGAYTLNHTDS
ncbi:MAG TPA: class I SAM-dependent methyltransferase [Nitrospira sp.]